jgi:hypothetical protein
LSWTTAFEGIQLVTEGIVTEGIDFVPEQIEFAQKAALLHALHAQPADICGREEEEIREEAYA